MIEATARRMRAWRPTRNIRLVARAIVDILLIAGMVLGCFVAWQHYRPYNDIYLDGAISVTLGPHTPGSTIGVSVPFCNPKGWDIVSMRAISDKYVVYPLPTLAFTNQPPGCQRGEVAIQIPAEVPTAELAQPWQIVFTTSYRPNPFRVVTLTYETPPFRVVAK